MYKQVIVVRKDLKWGKGKMIAHSIHAAVGAMRMIDEEIVNKWEKEGSKKVVLKIENLKELKSLYSKVKKLKLPCFLVRDAGKTQLKAGTITCLGIGPIEENKINKITGKLKLL